MSARYAPIFEPLVSTIPTGPRYLPSCNFSEIPDGSLKSPGIRSSSLHSAASLMNKIVWSLGGLTEKLYMGDQPSGDQISTGCSAAPLSIKVTLMGLSIGNIRFPLTSWVIAPSELRFTNTSVKNAACTEGTYIWDSRIIEMVQTYELKYLFRLQLLCIKISG